MEFRNGEKEVKIHSVIVHETDTGYAECFRDDAYNFEGMGEINLEDIVFSDRIKEEWKDKMMWEKILKKIEFQLPNEI